MPDLEFASVEHERSIGQRRHVAMLWVVRVVVALAFGFIGANKLSTDPLTLLGIVASVCRVPFRRGVRRVTPRPELY